MPLAGDHGAVPRGSDPGESRQSQSQQIEVAGPQPVSGTYDTSSPTTPRVSGGEGGHEASGQPGDGDRAVLNHNKYPSSRYFIFRLLPFVVTLVFTIIGQALPSFELKMTVLSPKSADVVAMLATVALPHRFNFSLLALPCAATNLTCAPLSATAARLTPVNESSLLLNLLGLSTRCNASWSCGVIDGTIDMSFGDGTEVAAWLTILNPGDSRIPMGLLHCDASVALTGVNFTASSAIPIPGGATTSALAPLLAVQLQEQLCAAVGADLQSTPGPVPASNGQLTLLYTARERLGVFTSVRELLNIREIALALVILLFSGVWPYVKLIGMAYVTLFPVPPRTRLMCLSVFDAFGKWSFIDVIIVIFFGVVLRMEFASTLANGSMSTRSLAGLYVYAVAVLLSIILNMYLLERAHTEHPNRLDATALPQPLAQVLGLFPGKAHRGWRCIRFCLACVGIVCTVLGFTLPCFQVGHELRLVTMGVVSEAHDSQTLSLFQTAKYLLAQGPSAKARLGHCFVLFLLLPPLFKWFLTLPIICFLDCRPKSLGWAWWRVTWPFDFRDVLIVALFILRARSHSLFHRLSSGTADVFFGLDQKVGFAFLWLSVCVEFLGHALAFVVSWSNVPVASLD